MRSNFFLQRPVLAWVLALGVMLAGALGLRHLPLAQYPDIAPPAVMITAQYPGASAEVVENSVTKVLEQALKGVEHLLYFSATSNASGQAELMLTFAQGTDVDAAVVQVQNLASQALQRLPAAVQRNGLQVRKLQNSFLMILAVYDRHDRMEATAIADWMATTLEDPISRIDGVGAVQAFDAPHAMRIWLDPHKLRSVGLVPGDVIDAIETQNTDLSVGELGGRPAPPGQPFHVTVAAGSRLRTPAQFGAIVIKTQASGATVHLSQVARIELGSESYGGVSRLNGHPASALAVRLAPGANALRTAQAIQAQVRQLQPSFPAGLTVVYPEDSTRFVTLSITEVGQTLVEALVLVVLVMYVFLGSWRATWIPIVTVPVVLLGTCAVLALLGESLNTLTLFGMVLAIGLLVDDTIVVVENVERWMHTHGCDARTATAHAMEDVGPALVGIGLVLGCIFLPMAFFPGSVGVIYRQFSVTLVVAMALSVAVALCLTPVLCAAWLRPAPERALTGWAQRWHALAHRGREHYERLLGGAMARPWRVGALYLGLGLLGLWAYAQRPTAFLPEEDHGTVMVRFSLPAGATAERTLAVTQAVERYFLQEETASTEAVYVATGMSFDGAGQNAGMAFISLKPWAQRSAPEQRAQAIADRAMARLSDVPDAEVYAMVPPSVEGLGQSNGFELWLQDRGGLGHAGLARVADALVEQARAAPQIGQVRAQGGTLLPQLRLDIDEAKAAALGLDLGDLHTTLETAWGGRYVNDFVLNDHLRKVVVQGDAPYRAEPDNLRDWHVRGREGSMTSLAAVASSHWTSGLGELQRHNGAPALPVFGMAAPGVSSGEAMATLEALLAQMPEVGGGWGGLSFEERRASGQAGWLYAVSLLFIFLCLAALYESWSVPCAVLLVMPLGGLGALAAAALRGLPNDIYFQVGLLTAMGLSAKNAVLIVEFAEAQVRQGVAWHLAATQAAWLRLRPILMTSLAFGAGVLPLALAWGPHAASQNAIGTSVLGGVMSGTVLVLLFVPLAYGIVVRVARRGRLALAVVGLTGLVGCASAPPVEAPEDVRSEGLAWADYFVDERLRQVLAQALAHNRDVRAALHNTAAARAVLRQAQGAGQPTVGATWATERSWQSTDTFDGQGWSTSHAPSLTVAYEVDLFGRLAHANEAALQRHLASHAGTRALQLSLLAATAQAYVQLAADQALLQLARDTQANAERSAALIAERQARGLASRQDVWVQQTLVHQAQADAVRYERQCALGRHALTLLVGTSVPAEWWPEALGTTPYTLARWPESVDTQVLLRRPDVQQAEHQLRAAQADVAAAQAALLPVIRLGGDAGWLAESVRALLHAPTKVLAWTLDASVPLFSGGVLQARQTQAEALQQAARAQYDKALQTALREVADVLVTRATLGRELAAQQALLDDLTQQHAIVSARYRLGRDGALALLDMERQVYAARATLLRSRLAEALNGVDVYRSLGGEGLTSSPPHSDG